MSGMPANIVPLMTPEEALASVRRVAHDERLRIAPVPPDFPLRVCLALDALAARIEALQPTEETHA